MMKRFLLVTVGVLFIQSLFANIPAGYYDSATGSGYTLKTQLYNIIDGHTVRTYTNLWTDMQYTDKRADGYVWDMYSNCDFTFVTDQDDGSATSTECDYYNREHSFPKSWFAEGYPMYTDLFHLYPTDKVVNGKRSNFPFGEVGSAFWTSVNGSKLGTCDYPGYSGTVFEPIDEYKGDFARTYFYMATRYENIIAGWESNSSNGDAVLDGTSDQVYEEWYLNMMTEWHNNDPVSQKELNRNDSVYTIQSNRNPFIDHPEYVAEIWGGVVLNNPPTITDVVNSPVNPTSSDAVTVTATITDSDGTISSAELHWGLSSGVLSNIIDMSVSSGNTYSSNTDILAQIDGTTVYYEIEATDDSLDVTTTIEYSYNVDDNPAIAIIDEDFTTCPAFGWTTYSIAGSENWECGTNGMQVNAFGSDVACDDWLISPAIDLNSYSNEILTFTSWTRYTDTDYPQIELKYSTDYSGSGDPSSANWYNLTATWSVEDSQTWTGSGDIDLSSIVGSQVYIVFHYTSSGTEGGTSAWWEIDDILIIGDASSSNIAPEISGISIDPTSPTENDDVTVSATITDSDGTISATKIKWGTSPENYSNTDTMTYSGSGDIYIGIILKQTGGTIVYYIIEAVDNEPDTTQSGENSFSFTAIPNELPEITDISHSPISPLETDDVTIFATITDSDGTISTADIKWGTSTGNYPNTVSMTNSGDDYSGVIPAQSDGTHVYFVVYAEDNEGGSAQSSENDYLVDDPNILPEITGVGFIPTDPESTETVSVSATITDSDGTISTADIKWGTSTGSYPNTVSMTNSGDDYSGVIPAQSDGTHVYFVVYAEDNEGGSAQSSENDYLVDDPNILPEITGVGFIPTDPESTETVSVSATITDSDGTISTADIKWGTSTGNYTNTVSMTNSGDDYSGVIPVQSDGTHVYFVVYAEDNEGGSEQSSENDYLVDDPNILPEITGVGFIPTDPESTESVSVSATITDSDGTITTAEIKWGTSTGSYPNTVSMSNSGDDYSGVIPVQSDGTHVYFVVYAEDNEGGSEQSSENDYLVDDPNILPEITGLGFIPSDPESTETVSISATITDSDGTISSAEIKWGTSTGSYPNTVSMTNSGDDYSGVIPVQSDGTHVYFVVYAEDNEGGSEQSSENDYLVDDPNILPEITGVGFIPTDPESTESVSVSATITDSDGTISSAEIKWGTTTGNYPNTVSMSNSGDDYSGVIPAQADGTEVFFIIEAEDNEAGITLSSEFNYTVEDPENQAPVISDVILDPASPTEDENLIVSCIVDDYDGSVVAVVLKWKRGTGDYTDVSMNFSGGRYYGQIPKQSVGETIYFSIIAEDNEGLQNSYEGSYEVSESNSINDLENSSLKIYPNPTRNNINIEFAESGFINSIKIYNLIGKKMLEMSNLNAAKHTIELSQFPKGMYIIQVNNSENSIVRKVMLK